MSDNNKMLLMGLMVLVFLFSFLMWSLFFAEFPKPTCPEGMAYLARDGICVEGVQPIYK